jgi:kumamolisin
MSYARLPETKRTVPTNATKTEPGGPSEVAELTIRVRSRGDLKKLEREVYAQAARPLTERRYFSHDELDAKYGARPGDFEVIESVASQHGLAVVRRSSSERSIVLRGQMPDLLKAFPSNGELNDAELTEVVTGVHGYHTQPQGQSTAHVPAPAPNRQNPLTRLTATDVAASYSFPNSRRANLNGAGQTVAFIELGGGYRRADLNRYFESLGQTTPRITAVSVDGGTNTPLPQPDQDTLEVMQDLEIAGAVVPDARFVVYFAADQTDRGLVDAISAAVHDSTHHPGVISISWGEPEECRSQEAISACHELFIEAAALGITVCASSGDHGTADLDGDQWANSDKEIHVHHPACDPFVLACGGTMIKNGKEVAWNEDTPFGPHQFLGGGWATGGGISKVFPVPGYQKNVKLPESLASNWTGTGRGVPDIAMRATNSYVLRVGGRQPPVTGGTSAVAPLMAALVAQLNQATRSRVGYLNPFLYANSTNGIFSDVIGGNNAIPGATPGYEACEGWDACTGWGTPVGTALSGALRDPRSYTDIARQCP